MKEEELNVGCVVRNIKHGSIESVLHRGIMKQDDEWVDCVVYQGEDRFNGGRKVFVKKTEDFLNEFELVGPKTIKFDPDPAKECVPNNIYKFRLYFADDYPFPDVTIPTKVIEDRGWDKVDEFDNDEDAVRDAYFTPDVIEYYRSKFIEKILQMDNPFMISCCDRDGNYLYSEEELFRKTNQ